MFELNILKQLDFKHQKQWLVSFIGVQSQIIKYKCTRQAMRTEKGQLSFLFQEDKAMKGIGEGILAPVGLLLACSLSTCLPRLWVDDNTTK